MDVKDLGKRGAQSTSWSALHILTRSLTENFHERPKERIARREIGTKRNCLNTQEKVPSNSPYLLAHF